jgi:predicted NAD-dependent protein-ADP-ribosyltransferase YbiA (DUF1768 family)
VAITRIYRDADGERINGTLRSVFIRNGRHYYLSDLHVYADGAIHVDGAWVDLNGLREKLRNGRVATSLPAGARAFAHHLASWQFAEPHSSITAEQLLGEAADDIDRLNGRPDSTGRCLQAADQYLQTRTDADRAALREAYEAIPGHMRVYALGDMDRRDWPLRVLCTDPGTHLVDGDEFVTEQMLQEAIGYFAERERAIEKASHRTYPDGPEGADSPTLTLNQVVFPKGWPAEPGNLALRNEYPAPIAVDGVTYPTAVHAYWALATTSPEIRSQIRDAARPYDAEQLAGRAPLRPDWPAVRLAVMASLLRAKYTQHPQMAGTLLATGDARIHYTGLGSRYWNASPREGRNWIGRLLELVRAEIAADRASGPIP